MPTYVYEIVTDSPAAGQTFEIVQSIKDPPLVKHPETGQPVRRIIQPPYIPGPSSDHAARRTVSDNKRLGDLGFTKYVRSGGGTYEKAAGKGPDVISAD